MSKNLETKIGKVRAFLEEGNTITSWDAIKMFGYTRLAAGKKYLEDNYGLSIASKMVYEDDGVKYAKYWLTISDDSLREIKDYLLRGNKITESRSKDVFGIDNFAILLNCLREDGIELRSKMVRPLCGKPYIEYYL